MNVTLLDYTGAGSPDPARAAANVLMFTKATRLEMKPGLMSAIEMWPAERVQAELAYMANTIPSSWEFVSYTFLINDVTRAFTHQLVRTRTGSYAQQTMRVLNVDGWTYGTGPTIEADPISKAQYVHGMKAVGRVYKSLIAAGAKIEDARGVLPTNIHTNIVAKFDLRTLADTLRKRASVRTQGEYRDVLDGMRAEVFRVHPWAEMFVNRSFDVAAAELESRIQLLPVPVEERVHLTKLIDQLRATA